VRVLSEQAVMKALAITVATTNPNVRRDFGGDFS
jgi:hypothetical protein